MTTFNMEDFRVRQHHKLDLEAFPTRVEKAYRNKAHYIAQIQAWRRKLRDLQVLLYASAEKGLLAAFQGLDGSGKDSIARRVFAGVNPRGAQVTSFKQPTPNELKHSWLWRHERAIPKPGMIGIWDRTHYEEVGAVRVHPELLRVRDIDPSTASQGFWQQRLETIRKWEEKHAQKNTVILKFFLHVSSREQAQRLLDRILRPEKNWKFSANDLKERRFRHEYLDAYAEAMASTSTPECPWYVIPADDKRAAAFLISQIVNHRLKSLKLEFPQMTEAQRRALRAEAAELRREIGED